jgi:hypothetical protein
MAVRGKRPASRAEAAEQESGPQAADSTAARDASAPKPREPGRPRPSGVRSRAAGHVSVCGRRPADPAHVVPRSLGGCDDADCVVPLCRRCHRAHDRGELDLLPYLEPGYRVELADALRHVSLLALLRQVTGVRWVPLDARSDEGADARPSRGSIEARPRRGGRSRSQRAEGGRRPAPRRLVAVACDSGR